MAAARSPSSSPSTPAPAQWRQAGQLASPAARTGRDGLGGARDGRRAGRAAGRRRRRRRVLKGVVLGHVAGRLRHGRVRERAVVLRRERVVGPVRHAASCRHTRARMRAYPSVPRAQGSMYISAAILT